MANNSLPQKMSAPSRLRGIGTTNESGARLGKSLAYVASGPRLAETLGRNDPSSWS